MIASLTIEGILLSVWYVLLIALLFGGTVFVHELGHFWAARKLGFKVKAFSIGMGPVLLKKTVNGVEYRLSALPIGGYVSLPQMDITGSAFEDDEAEELQLVPVAPWKRIVVAIAGPFMNVVLALILCYVVYWMGKPMDLMSIPAEIGFVHEESEAYAQGMREGDLIVQANGRDVETWGDFVNTATLNKQVDLTLKRGDETIELTDIDTVQAMRRFRLVPGVGMVIPDHEVDVRELMKGLPAFDAGVHVGDTIVSVDGKAVNSIDAVIDHVKASQGTEVVFGLKRKATGEVENLAITPVTTAYVGEESGKVDEVRYMIGVAMERRFTTIVHPEPWSQMAYFGGAVFRVLEALTTPEEVAQVVNQVGSFVLIGKSYWDIVKEQPFSVLLWFTALINVNLAIMNLLPILILDGGHIMVAIYEMIIRKPPKREVMIPLANAAAVLLIGLMATLAFRDVWFLATPEEVAGERMIHKPFDKLTDDQKKQVLELQAAQAAEALESEAAVGEAIPAE